MLDRFWHRCRNVLVALSLIAVVLAGVGSTLVVMVPTSHAAPQLASTCAQPPDWTKRDPHTLSLVEIATYGLPPRPSGARASLAALARWIAVVKHSTHRICDANALPGASGASIPGQGTGVFTDYTGGRLSPSPAGSPVQSQITPSYGGFNNVHDFAWSGYAAYPASGWGLNEANGYWNVPCIPSGHDFTYAHSMHWVGLGGGGNQLLQVGTESNDDGYPHAYYDAFVENTGPLQSQSSQTKFSVHCGDSMYGDVWLPNNVYISDQTSGTYYFGVDGTVSGANTNWECISERPNASDYALADFNYVVFSYCDGWNAGDTASLTINGTSIPADLTLYGVTTNHLLAWNGVLNSNGDGWTTYWSTYT